ncbi:MAG: hypothetical protein ACI31C_06610 [Muribaculaceae bacterium]
MSKIIGVLTGDIIESSAIKIEYRDFLLESMRNIAEELSIIEPVTIEFFRGDSFQMIINNPENAMKVAVLLRVGLKSRTPKDCVYPWDTRISLGVGTISYHADRVVLSDGEAFQYSGRGLDEMGKRKLIVKTRWSDVNDELRVSTAFADDVISSWSIAQSQAAFYALLYNYTQKEIANKLQKSAQNISKLLSAAKLNIIQMYIDRYHILISNSLK